MVRFDRSRKGRAADPAVAVQNGSALVARCSQTGSGCASFTELLRQPGGGALTSPLGFMAPRGARGLSSRARPDRARRRSTSRTPAPTRGRGRRSSSAWAAPTGARTRNADARPSRRGQPRQTDARERSPPSTRRAENERSGSDCARRNARSPPSSGSQSGPTTPAATEIVALRSSRKRTSRPSLINLGTYACKKMRSTERT